MDSMLYFAERLEDLMIENDLVPRTLGEAVGIDRSTITRYLNGSRLPSVATLVAIADYFKCTVDFLLGFEEVSRTDKFKPCPPFKERLSVILAKANTNKYGLRKRTEIAESAIYDWQRGDNEPSLGNIILIAKKLNMSVDFILGRVDYN